MPRSRPPGPQAGLRAEVITDLRKWFQTQPAQLLAEFEKNRAATIQAVEAADEELFARRIRSAGGVVGPLATVFYQIAVAHVLGHANDILTGHNTR